VLVTTLVFALRAHRPRFGAAAPPERERSIRTRGADLGQPDVLAERAGTGARA